MGWEGAEERSDALPCFLYGSLGGFSQEQLELGEDLFDGIEVGGVGRQEQQPGSSRADRLADGRALVTAKIVHDDHIAGSERGHEELLDPCGKALAADRPIEDARRVDPVMAKCSQEGQRAPLAERSGTVSNFVREAIRWNGKDPSYGDRQGSSGPAAGWA